MGTKSKQSRNRRDAQPKRDPWTWGLIIGAIVAVGLVVVLGVTGKEDNKSAGAPDENASSELASGKAPAFSAVDARTGQTVTNKNFQGKKMLLFFSEGVACQACMVQVTKLEQKKKELKKRNISLLSISVDEEDALKQAASDFKIKNTPLLADPDSTMSTDYDMLGKGGMRHPELDGHAFMLVDEKGKILWEQEYEEMFVEPKTLFEDMSNS